MGVARDILDLAKLAGVKPDDVGKHFVLSAEVAAGAAAIELVVANEQCAVVTSIDLKNVDESQTATLSVHTATSGVAGPARLALGISGEVLYVFGPGSNALNFILSSAGGFTGLARVAGYFLPLSCLKSLSRHKTIVIEQ